MKRLFLVAALALGAAILPLDLAAAETPATASNTVTTIDFPKATKTWAMANNAAGDIVGYYMDTQYHGFLLRGGAFTSLDYPGADVAFTQANGINAAGDITGLYSLKSGPAGNVHGFRLTAKGAWSTADYPVGEHLMAGGGYGISDDGTVVGCYHDGNPPSAMHGYALGSAQSASFDYPANAAFAMHYGVTPDGKTFVGGYLAGANTPDNWHGYVLKDGKVTSFDVPGKTGGQALGIGPAGQILGMYRTPVDKAWNAHGFLAETSGSANPADWKFTLLDVPGATQTVLRSIDAAGNLVGCYFDAAGVTHGFQATAGALAAPAPEAAPVPAAAPAPPSTGSGLATTDGSPWTIAGVLLIVLAGPAAIGRIRLHQRRGRFQ